MNNTDFTYLLQNPISVTHQQTEAVKSIIDEFPYFQSARALYLKGLKNQQSFKYNQELKITAAYTTDRSILFDFITSEAFIQNEISQFIKQNTGHLKDIEVTIEDISFNKSDSVDNALKRQIKDTLGVLDPDLFKPKIEPAKIAGFKVDDPKTIEAVTNKTKTQDTSTTHKSPLGKPLDFDISEKHSFNEWLRFSRFKPIERDETKTEIIAATKTSKELERAKKFELIDKFIIKNPKISPTKSSTFKNNIAKAQMIQPEALMTETLARIYVEQKNYKKAIQSYKILSLKYPEKSSFFAVQIKEVQQLQEQNNKE